MSSGTSSRDFSRLWKLVVKYLPASGIAAAFATGAVFLISYLLLKPEVEAAKSEVETAKKEAVKAATEAENAKRKAEAAAADAENVSKTSKKLDQQITSLLTDENKKRVLELVQQIKNNATPIDKYLDIIQKAPVSLLKREVIDNKSAFDFTVPAGANQLRIVLSGQLERYETDSDCYIQINDRDNGYTSFCLTAREKTTTADSDVFYHGGRFQGFFAGVAGTSKSHYLFVDYNITYRDGVALGQGQSTYTPVDKENKSVCHGYYGHGMLPDAKPITKLTVRFAYHDKSDRKPSKFTGDAYLYAYPPPQ